MPMPGSLRRRLPRLLVALLVVGAIAVFFAFGPSESDILARQAAWRSAVEDNLLLALLIFFVVEVILVAFSVPIATGMSVLAGMLFGRWLGTLVVSFASTLGALLAMLTARYVLRDSIRRRLETRPRWKAAIAALDRGVERDSGFYVLVIRMTPVFPFFLVNLGMGLTRIRLWTYWWATQLGMLPMSFVVVSAGAEVGDVTSFRELASVEHWWPVMLLVLIPIGLRLATRRYLRRREPLP